jgi:hypothetical protein
VRAAWDGNPTSDNFVTGLWERNDRRVLTVVNYGGTQGQCYAPIDVPELIGRPVFLTDLLGDVTYERDGSTLTSGGLYLDLPPWGRHVFELTF